jgi:hypothetical protein
VSVKSKSLGRDPTGKGGKSSQNYNNISKLLFQSTISLFKHICSFLRESRLSETRCLKILVKVNIPSRSAHTSKIIFFYKNSSVLKTTFTFFKFI